MRLMRAFSYRLNSCIVGLAGVSLLAIVINPQRAYAESLDLYYSSIKSSGSLREFCKDNPMIDECNIAIGEWKPAQLEKVKISSPQCYGDLEKSRNGLTKRPVQL